jgi:hypothetical protein
MATAGRLSMMPVTYFPANSERGAILEGDAGYIRKDAQRGDTVHVVAIDTEGAYRADTVIDENGRVRKHFQAHTSRTKLVERDDYGSVIFEQRLDGTYMEKTHIYIALKSGATLRRVASVMYSEGTMMEMTHDEKGRITSRTMSNFPPLPRSYRTE